MAIPPVTLAALYIQNGQKRQGRLEGGAEYGIPQELYYNYNNDINSLIYVPVYWGYERCTK